MALKKLLLKSGVNKENTRYTNENGWYLSDKVRFRQGTPEKNRWLVAYLCQYFSWYRDWETDRKSTRLNSSHSAKSRMPSSA